MKKNHYLIVEHKTLNSDYLEEREAIDAAKKLAAEMAQNTEKIYVVVKVVEIVMPTKKK